MPSRVLHYDDCPPSLNSVATAHWRKYQKAKKLWQGILEGLLLVERLPRGLDRVTATAVLTYPYVRDRDEGNFRFFLEKCLGDALQNGGWLSNDTPDHFSFGEVTFEKGPTKRTVITIQYT